VQQVRSSLRRLLPLQVRRPVGIGLYRVYRAVRNALREVLGRLPFLAARDFVYDESFYAKGDPMKLDSYPRFADALIRLRSPRSVVDVGSGSGLMLAEFAKRGVDVRGIEGSRAAIARSQLGGQIMRANLERGVPDVGRFDLALCIEVAEHLTARSAPRLVEGLTRLSDVVVFTASQRGEGGLVHMNPQPESYWQALFAEHGFDVSPLRVQLLEAIADVPEPRYLHENLMVFERAPQPAS
jgi:2-polyprenyl-3-methyl-5-hydroxy-6-metoxy-1,4-benzoquinol methylase